MSLIGRYIYRTTMGAFLMILGSLTAVIWVTQALRDIDLVTSQGQTILVFIGITGLAIPMLVLIIAPIALVIAVTHVLNKLSTDSEIIVMNAAGMPPFAVFRAFIWVAVTVATVVSVTGAYLAPLCVRELRDRVAEARADFVANIVQPGRFTADRGLTFHIAERRPNGQLGGLFVDDRRDPKERTTFLAEEGDIVRDSGSTFLVMQRGSVQRYPKTQADPTIVLFDRYAFDLSQFTGTGVNRSNISARERYIWQLWSPDLSDPKVKSQLGQLRAELNDRIAAFFYPFVFVIIAYAYLGAPRTNRQSRGLAIVSVIGAVALVRLSGFMSVVFSVQTPIMGAIQYVAFALAIGLGLTAIWRGTIIEMPAAVTRALDAVSARLVRRFATT